MKIRKIFLDAEGGGTSEIIDDVNMVSEWTVAMSKKASAKELFESLVEEIKTQINTNEGSAYGGDTQAIINKFNNLVTKFDSEFIDVMNEQDGKLANATELYKGFQGSMDSIFTGDGEGGGSDSTAATYGA